MKAKKYMIISIDKEKSIRQNPTPFHDISTQQIRNRREFP